jgi:aspartyl-tRNA synthetase
MTVDAFLPEHKRTLYCGQVRPDHIGKEVVLCGWVHRRRDHGGLVFVDLRDREGLVQVVFNPGESSAAHGKADGLRVEYVLSIRGTVRRRPEGTENPNLPTGEVEVAAASLAIPTVPADPVRLEETDVVENATKYRVPRFAAPRSRAPSGPGPSGAGHRILFRTSPIETPV